MTDTSTSPAVRARGLCRRFGPRWVLVHVDFEVPRGSALMVTGHNGSGKTTLLRCLATALRPHDGELELLGKPGWASRDALRSQIALVSHATRLYEDLGALENLRVWAALGGIQTDLRALLTRVGLDPDRPEPVRAYSAGMRRRAALALALMKDAELWLFDEPFAALDPEGRAMMAGVMRDLRARGRSLVIATHLPAVTGPICDHAIHLDAGHLVWTGDPAQSPARTADPEDT